MSKRFLFFPGVSASVQITPAAGAVVFTGYAPTVASTVALSITPDAGSVVLAGAVPVLARTANVWLTPGAGSVVLTGSAPSLDFSYWITPAASSVLFSGAAPTVARTAHVWVTPAASSVLFSGAAPTLLQFQTARPASDVTVGAWVPSTGSDLYAMIDEPNVDDADHIYTAFNAAESEVALSALQDPLSSTGHTLRYRVEGNGSSGITVTLLCGSTVIASWTHDPAPSSWTTYEQTLSSGQADAITDYSDLRVRFYEYAPLMEEDSDYLVDETGENLMVENG